MRVLTDKAIHFRTFPVIPRKRVKFDQEKTIEHTLFGLDDIVFKCRGGYFTHKSYCLLDYFVSCWFEIVAKKWSTEFGEKYPKRVNKQHIDKLKKLTPILDYSEEDLFDLKSDLIELVHELKDYVVIEQVSDLKMRQHLSLKGITSRELYHVIDRTSKTQLNTICPVKVVKDSGKQKHFGWFNELNIDNNFGWSRLFQYRLLEEKTAQDGRIIERIYKFGFTEPLGILMIHNTICGGFWDVNPNLYSLSQDAQLIYRYMVIAGSKIRKNRLDFVGHRIGRKEKQPKRLAQSLETVFQELADANLIENVEITSMGLKKCYYCSFNVVKKKQNQIPEKS